MSDSTKNRLIGYRYDALNRLVSSDPVNDASCKRFYRESDLASEIKRCEQVSIVQYGNQLLAQQQRMGDSVSSSLLATDLQRSVINALRPSVQSGIAYSPYGHRHCESGLSTLLGFNGQRAEPVTGHYLLGNGYRALNPVLMRFNSPDSYSPFNSGGLNCYAYCGGDPINRFDPSGHSFISWFFAAPQARTLTMKQAHKVYRIAKQQSKLGSPVSVKPFSYAKRIAGDIDIGVGQGQRSRKLTVRGHGAPGFISVDDSQYTDAAGLYGILKDAGVDFKKFDSVRMVVCHSAEGYVGSPSLAESFSQLSGLRVKGYSGVVVSYTERMEGMKIGESLNRGASLGVHKGRDEDSRSVMKELNGIYAPQTFHPGVLDESRDNIRR